MQERCMRGINADLQRLQPVTLHLALEREGIGIGRDEAVDLRKCRRLAFAEIGPKDTALFHHWISALLDILAEVGIGRLRRRLQAIAFNIEQPAVEGTAQAAILEAPE